jgi:hypothetical protein
MLADGRPRLMSRARLFTTTIYGRPRTLPNGKLDPKDDGRCASVEGGEVVESHLASPAAHSTTNPHPPSCSPSRS